MGSYFTVNAQSYSFETSEGYELGQLSGQNEWNVSQAANPEGITVSDEDASEGTYSLSLVPENGTVHSLIGAFGPGFEVEGDIITFSFDIKTSELSEEGSDYHILAQSPSQQLLTSRVIFSYDGIISVVDYTDPNDEESLDIVATDATFEGDTWYHVEVVQNNAEGTIEYYLDDELFYTGAAFGATNVEQIVILHDNYGGSVLVDDIQVVEGTTAVKEVTASKLSVYPNPANNVVTVSGADALVSNVAIVDINGRTVKSVKFAGVAEAQVNVSDLASGVYVMTIASDKGTTTQKIVKN